MSFTPERSTLASKKVSPVNFTEEDGDVDDGGWFREAVATLFWRIERTIQVRARLQTTIDRRLYYRDREAAER